MKINRAYKVELDPNDCQKTAFLRAAGAARWAYNWGLRKKTEAYEARKAAIAAGMPKDQAPEVPDAMKLHKELVRLKNLPVDQGGVPWMYDSSKSAPHEALRNLDNAFKNFFRRCKDPSVKKKGYPKLKSRKRTKASFYVTKGYATETHVHVPNVGKVKLKERGYAPTKNTAGVEVKSVTVSQHAGHWFASVRVVESINPSDKSHLPVLGVDVGIKILATLSDGRVFENPRALASASKRLARLQRSLSRKVVGSNNRRKAAEKVARQHYKITCVRKDAIHKASDAITKQASIVVLEDLNVAGMMRNPKLAKSVSDASMSEIHRQIQYKAAWRGVRVVTAGRWYPSSKTCSACGTVKQTLLLSDRIYHCDSCGHEMDRDLNAAINLANLAATPNPAGSSSVAVCGEEGSGRARKGAVKPTSAKQKPNTDRGLTLVR